MNSKRTQTVELNKYANSVYEEGSHERERDAENTIFKFWNEKLNKSI